MSSRDLTLYVDARFLSPYAMSAFVTLHEKGIAFAVKTVDLATGENRRPGFAGMSLTQRVPTLVQNGFHLSESSAISEYLEDSFPEPPVYPRDVRERARARQVQAWLRSDLMPIRQERPTDLVFGKGAAPPLSEAAQAAAQKLFSACESLLPSKGENLFDAWCIADTDLALMLNRLVRNGDPVPDRLAAYARHQWQRPSVRLWLDRAQAAHQVRPC